jgi:energy-coupling factor transporter ATP-binding protein EcfA2
VKTLVVNLYGGPGCGKSTMAAELYAILKNRGASVELVREYVKNWAWRGQKIDQTWDQPYLFAKQLRLESALYGKVDVVITDSPLGLCKVYEQMYSSLPPDMHMMSYVFDGIRTQQKHLGIDNLNLQVVRQKAYVQSGRYEDEGAARIVDSMCQLLIPNLIPVNNVGDALSALADFKVNP